MFPNLGMSELILILVIALVVFGPRKLPEIGKSLGKTINEFRRASLNSFGELENVAQEVKEGVKTAVVTNDEADQAAKTAQEKS